MPDPPRWAVTSPCSNPPLRLTGRRTRRSYRGNADRLGRVSVDLFQFLNAIDDTTSGANVGADAVLEEVVPAFQRVRDQGKFRFFGITANGETPALHRVIDARAFDTGQASYNLLNPSPGGPVPANYPAQDYGNLLGHAQAADMGIIVIRVLAGGALSGTEERHPNASPPPDPIGSGCRWCRKAMPTAWSRPRSATSSRIGRSRPC